MRISGQHHNNKQLLLFTLCCCCRLQNECLDELHNRKFIVEESDFSDSVLNITDTGLNFISLLRFMKILYKQVDTSQITKIRWQSWCLKHWSITFVLTEVLTLQMSALLPFTIVIWSLPTNSIPNFCISFPHQCSTTVPQFALTVYTWEIFSLKKLL